MAYAYKKSRVHIFFAILCVLYMFSPFWRERLQANEIDFMDTCDIVRSKEYPCEDHKVTTEDGYILTLHRIPHGRDAGNMGSSGSRTPILLMHGGAVSSSFWIIGSSQEAFGYILADAGFDVWMGNTRGNMYSLGHVNKSITHETYWKYTFDETGAYDIPAFIDYSLSKTGHDKLYYVGHSAGATNYLIAMSRRPSYNSKVRLMIGMAPGVYFKHMTSSLRIAFAVSRPMQRFYEIMGWYNALSYNKYASRLLSSFFCNEVFLLTKMLWFLLVGPCNNALFNTCTLPAFFAQFPAGVSIYMGEHLIQWYNTGEFRSYSYPTEEMNIQKYGQLIPPVYDLKNVTSPVVLFHGESDIIVPSKDVERVASELPNIVDVIRLPSFNHFDFAFAINASSIVLEPALKIMKEF